jgi:hypothetical protein
VYPSEYVYRPSYGWVWLSAPWVYGYGPSLYFGIGGPRYYGWYRGGYVRHGVRGYYGGRGHYTRGYYGGRGYYRGYSGGYRGGYRGGHVIRGGRHR